METKPSRVSPALLSNAGRSFFWEKKTQNVGHVAYTCFLMETRFKTIVHNSPLAYLFLIFLILAVTYF